MQQNHLRTRTDTVSVCHQQQNHKDKSRPAAFHTAVTKNSDSPWWTWRCSHYNYPATPVHTVWLWEVICWTGHSIKCTTFVKCKKKTFWKRRMLTHFWESVAYSFSFMTSQVDDMDLLWQTDRAPARTAWHCGEALQHGLHWVAQSNWQKLTGAAEQGICRENKTAWINSLMQKTKCTHSPTTVDGLA